MNSVEFEHLGLQVEHLMRMIEALQSENVTLRQKMAIHIKERTRLLHKNQRAVKQVRDLIKEMKEQL